MKQVYSDKIVNIDSNIFDKNFLFFYLDISYEKKYIGDDNSQIQVFYIDELIQKYKNEYIYNNLNEKLAMYSEVYSPKDELQIFIELFDYAISHNKKIHIVGITLQEELQILEDYYKKSGYLREEVNCFLPDFKNTLVTVSVYIENLIWRGSDYKANGREIFFIPPVRESGQNKAMFKGINRGSIASIAVRKFGTEETHFLQQILREEKILPITLAKALRYNLEQIGYTGTLQQFVISY